MSHPPSHPQTSQPFQLIATLGSEPQVVTSALVLLRAQGIRIVRVVVVHTDPASEPTRSAMTRLKTGWIEAAGSNTELDCHPIANQGHIYADVETPQAGQAAFQALYSAIHTAKKKGNQVHLCIAGGRKNMGLFGMTAAQMLFDDDDHLWHLYSSGDFLKSRRLLPQAGDDVHLVEIPVLLRGLVSPALTDLKDISDVHQALEHTRQLRLSERLESGRSFMLGRLSPAEQRVISLLASEGLSDLGLAVRLYLSPRTVEQHLRSAYIKAAEHWELESVTRAQLIALLGPYFTFIPPKLGENPHDNPLFGG